MKCEGLGPHIAMNDDQAHLHEFLAVWDQLGLEYLEDLTRSEQNRIMSVLRDESVLHSNPIHYFLLRARFNTHRHYEIYRFESDLAEDEIRELFANDSQSIVDDIRRVGVSLYSDRANDTEIIIK